MGSSGPAEYIFYGSNIITMDENCPLAKALATKDGKIIAVGQEEDVFPLGSASTKYIALKENQTLLPGLIEAHQHPTHMIIARCLFVNCSAYYYQTYSQIKDLILKTVKDLTDLSSKKWCMLDGWDPELISDLPDLNWEILDGFSKDIPIVILGNRANYSLILFYCFPMPFYSDVFCSRSKPIFSIPFYSPFHSIPLHYIPFLFFDSIP